MLKMAPSFIFLDNFRRDQNAVAAVEFALVATFLFTLMAGGLELTSRIAAYRGVNKAAYSVAQIISEEPEPPGTTNYQDLQMAHDSAMLVFPQALAAAGNQGTTWNKVVSITISEAVMTKTRPSCARNCSYNAQIAWSWGDAKRPCATNLTATSSDSSSTTTTTLQPDAFVAGAAVIVDVAYTYNPIFLSNLLGPAKITKTIVLQPRNVPPTSYIQYAATSGDPGQTTICQANASSQNSNGSGNNNDGGNRNVNRNYSNSNGNGNDNGNDHRGHHGDNNQSRHGFWNNWF